MAINLSTLKTGVSKAPPRILIYGEEGVGKTTFGASAPNPVFLRTERGEGNIDMNAWDIQSYDHLIEHFEFLGEGEHNFSSFVIDTLDNLEPMVWDKLIKDRPYNEKGGAVKDITDYGYGKGYDHVIPYWLKIINCINSLTFDRNMMPIMTAHGHVRKYNPPDNEPYDRFTLKMSEKAAEKFLEMSDCAFFARKKIFVKSPDTKGKLGKAVGDGKEREIVTTGLPALRGKNRYSLPEIIKFDEDTWVTLIEYIPYLKALST